MFLFIAKRLPFVGSYAFTLYVDPKPKKRPKVYRFATVNPSQKDEKIAAEEFEKQINKPENPLNGQITVWLTFFIRPPKNTPKWQLPLMEEKQIRPNKSPDLDNYVKLILDALNGKLWEDDRYIVEMHSVKYYTTNTPKIEIVVKDAPQITHKTMVDSNGR